MSAAAAAAAPLEAVEQGVEPRSSHLASTAAFEPSRAVDGQQEASDCAGEDDGLGRLPERPFADVATSVTRSFVLFVGGVGLDDVLALLDNVLGLCIQKHAEAQGPSAGG